MQTCTIDGWECTFEAGENILGVARRNGAFIPTLCRFEPLRHEPGACGVCGVRVEDAAGPRMVAACNTPAQAGMRVDTLSGEVRQLQRAQVERILAVHDQNCVACARHGDCELQDVCEVVGLPRVRLAAGDSALGHAAEVVNGMARDMTKCIGCQRCVEVCRQVQGVEALTLEKGQQPAPGVLLAPQYDSVACVQCGQCILVCPTGALSEPGQCKQVLDWLADPDIATVFSFAPSVRVLLGEEFPRQFSRRR